MFGSGRASLSLRESYRQDLRQVKQVTEVEYIRFHAIFLDEMGVYDEDSAGRPVYNFSYVDQVYDGLLQNGVRPFVELSFMPKKLASKDALHAFWYKQNVAPPKDWDKWDDLIYQFTKHLVDRYGMDEVAEVVLRSLERTQYRFLGGRTEAVDLFRALRSQRGRGEASQPAFAGGRSRHSAGCLGRRIHPALC